VLARDVTVERRQASASALIAPDRDLPLERPGGAIERAAKHFEQVHAASPSLGAPAGFLAPRG